MASSTSQDQASGNWIGAPNGDSDFKLMCTLLMLHFRDRGQWMGRRKKVNLDQSLWRKRSSQPWCFICPLCKGQRRLKNPPQPGGFKQISTVLIASAFMTLLLWNWLGWKGIVSFIPIWTV